jgi:hypothetical protein
MPAAQRPPAGRVSHLLPAGRGAHGSRSGCRPERIEAGHHAGARSAWRARSCPPQGGPDGSSQRARATHPQGRRIPARSALDHERGNLYLAQEQQQCWRGTSQSRARLNATARSVQSLGAFCPGDDLTESPSARQSPACDACPLGRLCNVYKPRHLRDDDRQRQ